MELEKSSNKAKKSYEVKWPMATREKKVFVLTGEGIECEKESKRFFSLMDCVQTCEFLPIYDFLDLEQLQKRSLNSGDLIFIPGGFSFADHYGAGKLLAHKIAQSGVLDWCFEKGVDFMGVCNGFQILVALGLFGDKTRLEKNQPLWGRSRFINRWVELESNLLEKESDENGVIRLPVRHGEGRLNWDKDPSLNIRSVLCYSDMSFCNGSSENAAALFRPIKNSFVCGMMPHPEVAWSLQHDPDKIAVDALPRFRAKYTGPYGDGLKFMHALFLEMERNRS